MFKPNSDHHKKQPTEQLSQTALQYVLPKSGLKPCDFINYALSTEIQSPDNIFMLIQKSINFNLLLFFFILGLNTS